MSDLDFAKVTGRFGLSIGDTSSDVDDDPDLVWCDSGRVFLTPLNTFVKVPGGVPDPFTMGSAVIEASIDADGYLTYNGKPYVHVVDLTSAKVNPQIGPDAATHRVTFSEVKAGTTPVDFPAFTCRLTAAGPNGDGENDLTLLAPVVPGEAEPIFQGPRGVSVESASINPAGELVFDFTDGTQENAGEIPVTAEALGAAATATEAADTATEAATTATSKAGEASGAATSAGTAKTAAETAKADAEAAKTAAETARDNLLAQKGTAGGLAELDGAGKLPEARVPERLSESGLSDSYAAKVQIVVDAAGKGDHTTIAAALAAAPAGGADVLVKRGIYTLTTHLTPPANTTLRGEGYGTVIKIPNGATFNAISVLAGANNVTIRDLRLDGNKANTVYGQNGIYTVADATHVINCHVKDFNGYNIVGFPGSTNLMVEGCVSEAAASDGIEFQGTVGGYARGNLVLACGTNGIYAYVAASDIAITGNVVLNSSARLPGAAGIRVDDGAARIAVTGNIVTGGGTSAPGISVSSSSAAIVKNVTVTGNTVQGTPGPGITTSVSQEVVISGNTVDAPGTVGISVGTLTGGTISDNAIKSPVGSGITVSGATKLEIANNTVRLAGAAGISVGNTSHVVVAGNVVTGSTTEGIGLNSSCTYATVMGNEVESSGQAGISAGALTHGTITGNVLNNNGGSNYNGIYVSGAASGLTITGNSVANTGRSGIRVEDSTNCVIQANIVKNSGKGGSVSLSAGILIFKGGGTCSGHIIGGNRCYDDQTTKTQYYGLRLTGAVDNCVIGANLFSGGATGGSDAYVDATATNISSTPYKQLTATVGTTQVSVAHGLPYIPRAVAVTMTSAGTVWKSAAADATNIYLTADAAGRTADVMVG